VLLFMRDPEVNDRSHPCQRRGVGRDQGLEDPGIDGGPIGRDLGHRVQRPAKRMTGERQRSRTVKSRHLLLECIACMPGAVDVQ